jgi:hypothetical protein
MRDMYSIGRGIGDYRAWCDILKICVTKVLSQMRTCHLTQVRKIISHISSNKILKTDMQLK